MLNRTVRSDQPEHCIPRLDLMNLSDAFRIGGVGAGARTNALLEPGIVVKRLRDMIAADIEDLEVLFPIRGFSEEWSILQGPFGGGHGFGDVLAQVRQADRASLSYCRSVDAAL